MSSVAQSIKASEVTSLTAAKKLKSSGLSMEDAKILGIKVLTGKELVAHNNCYKELAALLLSYFDPDGSPTDFERVRYLEQEKGFNQQTEKQTRYTQPPDTGVAAYFPKNLDWSKIIKDPSTDILLTEGELKSACACKLGFPTIGLGGVWNFMSNKEGVKLLEELNIINWKRRRVYIVYDSDFRNNPNVCKALIVLANKLMRLGAKPYMVILPDPIDSNDKKIGLDDFIVMSGKRAKAVVQDLIDQSHPLTVSYKLHEMNERYIYIRNPGVIGVREPDEELQLISSAALKEHRASNIYTQEAKINPKDGSIKYEEVKAAPIWLDWPCRAEASRITYAPGQPDLIESGRSVLVNTWPGYGCSPVKGDIRPFYDLLKHLFTGADPGAMTWFLRWCAYPLQFPGAKLFTAALFYGIVEGTGKTAIAYALGRIYDKNFGEIDQDDLHSPFNAWAKNKQLILVDDISTSGADWRHIAGKIRKKITQRENQINEKYSPVYSVPDCINYLMTSNIPDALCIEDTDRRIFVNEVVVGKLPREFYQEYDRWLKNEGPSHLFYYLLNLDLGDFNPNESAFVTSSKRRMIQDVKSDLSSWCAWLKDSPDQVLSHGGIKYERDLWSSHELLRIYDPTEKKPRINAVVLGREMSRTGFRQVLNGDSFIAGNNRKDRYFAVRNADRWEKASRKDVINHILNADTAQPAQTKPKRY